jgi:RNA polymerase sigma-70 factor (ECF subfamily)
VEVDLTVAAERVEAGDRSAFRIIVEQTQAPLFRLAARMMGGTADAEDTLQEAYVKAYRALADGQFDHRSAVRTWLYRVVVNTAIDALRRRAARPIAEDVSPDVVKFDPGQTAEAHVALREIDDWMRDLPGEQRAAVVLTAIEGMTTVEAAKVLGCSEGAVEQRLVRARATLRKRRNDDERE